MTSFFSKEFIQKFKENVIKKVDEEPDLFKNIYESLEDMSSKEFLNKVIRPNSIAFGNPDTDDERENIRTKNEK